MSEISDRLLIEMAYQYTNNTKKKNTTNSSQKSKNTNIHNINNTRYTMEDNMISDFFQFRIRQSWNFPSGSMSWA